MSTRILRALYATAALLTMAAPGFAQPAGTNEAVDYVNARVRHSAILRVTEAGVVRVRTPSETLTFKLQATVFSLNDQNGDHRVRIASSEPIEAWDGEHREDVTHRQSFVCRSRTDAREAIAALRRLKQSFLDKDPKYTCLKRKLAPDGNGGEYATLGEALDFVNDHLSHSVVLGLDDQGILTLQASDETIYRVDLARAEFGLNDRGGDPRVRIYGNWCIEIFRDGHRDQETPRESFTVRSRLGAKEVVQALYGIKAASASKDTAKRASLRNGSETRSPAYTTIPEAIDALNDRLAVSIVLGLDAQGDLLINASDAIYHVKLADCTFRKPKERIHLLGLIHLGQEEGVNIASPKGLRKYVDSVRWDTVDDQTFSCESESDTRAALQAFDFIKEQVSKGAKG